MGLEVEHTPVGLATVEVSDEHLGQGHHEKRQVGSPWLGQG